MRKHDADLCDRIRELEQRVDELEARPTTTYITNPPHYCYTGCPIHYPTWYGGWWTTSGTVQTNGTFTLPDGTQTTYTVGDTT